MTWLLLIAQQALAHGGEHVEEAAHHAVHIPWKAIFVQGYNLGLLVLVLYIILRKTVVAHFAHRASEYQQLVSRAEAARQEAEKGRREIKQRLDKLESESAQVVTRARGEAEELKSRMVQEAKTVTLRMEQEAERTIKAEVEKAKAELRRELLEKAIHSSRENMKTGISSGEQQKLQREFADKIQVVGG
jgi:F-type H+-transporting ATPase subunit b